MINPQLGVREVFLSCRLTQMQSKVCLHWVAVQSKRHDEWRCSKIFKNFEQWSCWTCEVILQGTDGKTSNWLNTCLEGRVCTYQDLVRCHIAYVPQILLVSPFDIMLFLVIYDQYQKPILEFMQHFIQEDRL